MPSNIKYVNATLTTAYRKLPLIIPLANNPPSPCNITSNYNPPGKKPPPVWNKKTRFIMMFRSLIKRQCIKRYFNQYCYISAYNSLQTYNVRPCVYKPIQNPSRSCVSPGLISGSLRCIRWINVTQLNQSKSDKTREWLKCLRVLLTDTSFMVIATMLPTTMMKSNRFHLSIK